ncbi:MAG: hypothetical protein AAB968_01150 [Patescibacteria group bacterium]
MLIFKDVLELISYFSQAGLLIVGIFALRQIRIAKQDIAIRSKRESIILAANQIEYLRKEFFLKMGRLNQIYESINGMKAPKHRFENFLLKELNDERSKIANIIQKSLKSLENKEFNLLVQELMNLLEGFSVYFIEGVADEQVAFKPLGQVFCDFIEENFFIYCVQRDQEKMNYFDNTIALYKLWSKQKIVQELHDHRYEIDEKLKKINMFNIKAIGTDV